MTAKTKLANKASAPAESHRKNNPFKGGTISSEEEKSDLIEFMNERWAIICFGGTASIMTTDQNANPNEPSFSLCTQQNFNIVTANYAKVLHGNRPIRASEFWLVDPKRREFHSITFDPSGKQAGNYNLFRGFAVKSVQGDCERYLDLVQDIICNGNDEAAEYVLNWLAHVIQKPLEKPETALVLRGRQGTGKTSFASIFGHLLGRHYIEESDMERVVGRFNAAMADKLVVLIDEGLWGGDRSKVGPLKAFITQKSITIEKKGVDSIVLPHHARLIIASNEAWAVHADQDDRRFVFLDVSDAKAQDSDYFSLLFKQMGAGGDEALLDFLQRRDISDFNPRQRPNTGFGQDAREVSMTPAQRFWFKVLQEGQTPIWDRNFNGFDEVRFVHHSTDDWQSIPKDKVFKAYLERCKEYRERYTAIEQVFWDSLYKMLGLHNKDDKSALDGGRKTIGSTRHRCICLLPIENLRRMYDSANQVSTEWEEIDRVDVSPDAERPHEHG